MYKKIVLLTGSEGLIGKGIVNFLSNKYFFICLDKKIYGKKYVKEKYQKFIVDTINEKQVNKVINLIKKKYKKIDVLLNCAVHQNFFPIEKQTFKSFTKTLVNNIGSVFLTTKSFIPLLKKSKSPLIINLGSIYGIVSGDPKIYTDTKRNTSDVYAASKAAIIQLTKYYAVHLSKYNIRVNCISPGGIKNNQGKNFINNYSKKTPLNRMAEKEEIVKAIKILIDDECKYINGHNLVVDGGLTIW